MFFSLLLYSCNQDNKKREYSLQSLVSNNSPQELSANTFHSWGLGVMLGIYVAGEYRHGCHRSLVVR